MFVAGGRTRLEATSCVKPSLHEKAHVANHAIAPKGITGRTSIFGNSFLLSLTRKYCSGINL